MTARARRRGAALVADIIAHVTRKQRPRKRVPLKATQLEAIERDAGAALPPSLRAWLVFDGSWLAKSIGAFELGKPRASALSALISAQAGPMAKAFEPLVRARFPEKALSLDAGSDSMRILYLGYPDAQGETPVLEIDHDDAPELGVAFAGFDLWLAAELGVALDLEVDVDAERVAVAKRVLGRTTRIDCRGPLPKKLGPIVRAEAPGSRPPSAEAESGTASAPSGGRAARRIELGVPLIELVIARIGKDGLRSLGARELDAPRPVPPATLERLRFPLFKQKLSPSLLRWLAFDGQWLESLGWFSREAPAKLAPQDIASFAARELGPGADAGGAFAPFRERLGDELYPLRTERTMATALYVVVPDSVGEHAVMHLELTRDGPRVRLLYPGFDVFMAARVGLFGAELPPLADIAQSVAYKSRMKEHQYRGFASKASYTLADLP